MPQIGPMELMVVAVVAFFVLGPDKLPGVARQVGRYASELRKMVSDVKDEFRMELRDDDESSTSSQSVSTDGSAPDAPASEPTSSGTPSDSGEPKS